MPNERALIETDIAVEFPNGVYGRVASRSGLAVNYSIDVGAGVIDPDYKGSIMVLLINNGKEKFQVNKGMRIAQLICEKALLPKAENTKAAAGYRGSGAIGSTGLY